MPRILPRFTAIVFDFDGTLVDTNALKRSGFVRVLDGDANAEATMRSILGRVVGDRRAVFEAFVAEYGPARTANARMADSYVSAYSALVDAEVARAPEIEGATHLLETLRRHGRRIILSSATPEDNLRRIVDARGWSHLFNDVFGCPATKTQTLSRTIDRYRLRRENLAVVGDGADDLESAKTMGCAFFPVGEARGTGPLDRIFTLTVLRTILLESLEDNKA